MEEKLKKKKKKKKRNKNKKKQSSDPNYSENFRAKWQFVALFFGLFFQNILKKKEVH